MEADGHRILKLNTGNPAAFGFDAPDTIVQDMIAGLPYAAGYSQSKGIPSARRAVVTRYARLPDVPRSPRMPSTSATVSPSSSR